MPNTYIQRTPSGGNRKKWTWSAWVRFTDVVSTNRYLWSGYSASNNTGYLQAYFHNDSQLNIGAWNVTYLNTTRLFRDPSAWYHIVIAMDTAQATASTCGLSSGTPGALRRGAVRCAVRRCGAAGRKEDAQGVSRGSRHRRGAARSGAGGGRMEH